MVERRGGPAPAGRGSWEATQLPSHPMRYLGDVLRGILMGSVYLVPGGDGGTVALVLGIYDRLIASLHAGASALASFLRGRFRDGARHLGEVEWPFLVPLVAGIAAAAATVASVIDRLLHDHPVTTTAVFAGLVLGGAVLAWRMVARWTTWRIAIVVLIAVITFFALGLQPGEFTNPGLLAFFGAGVVSMVALILPGFPGSTALLAIGMYQPILDAVNDRDPASLGAFVLGGVMCLAVLATVLDALLRSRHDAVVAGLIGLMLGSLRGLWPWHDDSGAMLAPVDWFAPLLLGLAGFAVVTVIAWWAARASSLQPPGPNPNP